MITIKQLRILSITEGISYLLLLFIGMPLKYGFDILVPNKLLGMGHGMLTLIFCATLYYLWQTEHLKGRLALAVFIASLIPFGPFVIDKRLKQVSV